MKRLCALLLSMLSVAACGRSADRWDGAVTDSAGVAIVTNPAAGSWSLAPAPEVTHDLDIGTVEGDAAYQFGTIAAIDVSDAGEILVLDQLAGEVRVFDQAGEYLRSLGKPGNGPGELVPGQTLTGLRAGRGDTVYVMDLARFRIAGFAGNGEEVGSYPVDLAQGIPVVIRPAADGKLAMQVRRMALPGITDSTVTPRDFIVLRDLTGATADTVASLEAGETLKFGGGGEMETRIFASEPVWTMLDDGRIVIGRNDVFNLQVYSPDGQLERVIRRPVEPVPVTAADEQAYRGMMRKLVERRLAATGAADNPAAVAYVDQMLKGMQFAESFPVFATLLGGPDNTLWVQRYPTKLPTSDDGEPDLENLTSPDWDIFDAQGRLLGTLTLPERFSALRVVGNAVYGVERDDLDVQHVVRLLVN